MRKKNIIILSSIIIIALIGAIYGMLDKPATEKLNGQAESSNSVSTSDTESKAESTSAAKEEDKKPAVIVSQDIPVKYNSAEFDLKASLYENDKKETFLKLEYFNDGSGVVKEIGEDRIPEIKGVFEAKQENGANVGIKTAFLNAKLERLYTIVESNYKPGMMDITLYSINLRDFSLKKLFSKADINKNTDIVFSSDFRYGAFNYSKISFANDFNSYLNIIKCESDEPIIMENRDSKGIILGNTKETENKEYKLFYDYTFILWDNKAVTKIKETVYKVFPGLKYETERQRDVLYDAEKNAFINPDGTPMTADTLEQKQGNGTNKQESEAVKALRGFHTLLAAEHYDKGFDMLDSSFKLRLEQLKQFGIEELRKSDMDVNSFSLYGSVFRTAEIESIVGEKPDGNLINVYYYASFSLSEGNKMRKPFMTQVKKTEKGWKITLVTDGNENEKPFKQ